MKVRLLVVLLLVVMLAGFAAAASHLPPGILKVQEYNTAFAAEFLQNISIAIAFLAGMVSLFSPCILPLFPAYFAVTFKEKRRITLATFSFFLGFTAIFVLMGLLATLTGEALVSVFSGINWLVPVAGIFLIIFGVVVFLGGGFSGFVKGRKTRSDTLGVFISGLVFAVGWTACIGPIISGVLLMAAAFRNYVTAAYLMFGYSLGIFVPLFLLSFFYDRFHVERIKWLYKEQTIKLGARFFRTTIPNIIAGVIFIVLGIVFIIFKGTWTINAFDMFSLRGYFYTLQDMFLQNSVLFSRLGMIALLVFAAMLAYYLVKEIRSGS